MASRPHNVGIKAIEIYFPNQVSIAYPDQPGFSRKPRGSRLTYYHSVSSRRSSRNSMALVKANTQLV